MVAYVLPPEWIEVLDALGGDTLAAMSDDWEAESYTTPHELAPPKSDEAIALIKAIMAQYGEHRELSDNWQGK